MMFHVRMRAVRNKRRRVCSKLRWGRVSALPVVSRLDRTCSRAPGWHGPNGCAGCTGDTLVPPGCHADSRVGVRWLGCSRGIV